MRALSRKSRGIPATLTGMLCLLPVTLVGTVAAQKPDAAGFSSEQLEHFEKRIRPLLAKRCFGCHSQKAKRLEAGLYLDSRSGMMAGGDSGPAIVPGRPGDSLLVQAIRYDGDYLMPPKGKLPDGEIRLLEEWVADGAPWPPTEVSASTSRKKFDLHMRRKSQWAWQQVIRPDVPAEPANVDPIDRFVQRRRREHDLEASEPASLSALARRLSFDLIGLPPDPEDIARLERDGSPEAVADYVDQLLASKHFGERWARHWMDLVRYAESRGHEFDYSTPNAHEYRDWLIRSFNADVPYDRFVTEQIAGDLLQDPRINPEQGFNESIIGTGFWFLGEWVHSPVDIRKDETDRHDNMIDVFGKTFLGMTIACARCHDHKFDPISQADYYAMSGFLQSSSYRLARFESLDHNRGVAARMESAAHAAEAALAHDLARGLSETVGRFDRYLLAHRELLLNSEKKAVADSGPDRIVFDFEDGTYDGWTVTGTAFGTAPLKVDQIADYQGNVNALGQFLVNSHNQRDKEGRVTHSDTAKGRAKSPEFRIDRGYLVMRIGGGSHAGRTCVNLLRDGQVVASLTGRNANQMHLAGWNVRALVGSRVQLELVDEVSGGWGNIGVDQVVLMDQPPEDVELAELGRRQAAPAEIAKVERKFDLPPGGLAQFLRLVEKSPRSPLAGWIEIASIRNESDAVSNWNQWAKRQTITDPKQCLEDQRILVDYANFPASAWRQDGVMFGSGPVAGGRILLSGNSDHPFSGVARFQSARRNMAIPDLKLASGAANDAGRLGGFVRSGQTIRTPTVSLQDGNVHVLVAGAGHAFAAVDSHRMLNGPLHQQTLTQWEGDADQYRWISFNLTRYRDHEVHFEFTVRNNQPLELLLIVEGKRPHQVPQDSAIPALWDEPQARSIAEISSLYRDAFQKSVKEFGNVSKQGPARTAVADVQDWILRNLDGFHVSDSDLLYSRNSKQLLERFLDESRAIRQESRVAMAMWDGDAVDGSLLIRGNHERPGEKVSRRILEALGGRSEDHSTAGSGRLKLARQVVSPENPLTSRVIVNRLWHHLFGRGIVASVDNFGVLGEEPSHPKLLDYLASEFVQNGWSIKRMIRRIVLTETYRMSSQPRSGAAERDPGNIWLHHASIRRLEGEAIRDAMLSVSGRLDPAMYGPSIPVHLSEFMQGRGRPKSGPVDGNGRRSVYISVRRNFLSAMMLAFDMPQPFSSMGRRTVSNVPGQALILMNDPFVQEQARLWARRLLDEAPDRRERFQKMFLMAFSRQPTAEEITASEDFLRQSSKRLELDPKIEDHPDAWAELCHVIFNTKEFIFLP